MSNNQGGFSEVFYGSIMPKIYGIGAAVVIVGALFKIMHYPGAGIMLTIGLGTEAAIFFFSAFEPQAHEDDWSRVYPELADDHEGALSAKKTTGDSGSVSKQLDNLMESANIGPELLTNLKNGMENLATSASKMATMQDASVATSEYVTNVKNASTSLVDINKSYTETASAMQGLTSASTNAQEYNSQLEAVSKNLGALNAVYEMELQDVNTHLKAMNKFYSSMGQAMDNMSEATSETESFKGELSKLTTSLTTLNTVYGNMLSAMRG